MIKYHNQCDNPKTERKKRTLILYIKKKHGWVQVTDP